MRVFLSSLFLALPLTVSIAAPALAEVSGKAIIVFDASGSMWGQINKTPKISIAKDVVKDVVKDWNQDLALGLTAYGHRRKGDCADIEALVPVSELDKKQFLAKIEKINPIGKTPLSDAVLQAAKELRYTEDKATVILVSDGIETCDRDPCEVARKLEETGIDLTVHVVGFDVKKKEEIAQLKCVADNTGGKFFSAQDAASLKASLAEIVEDVVASVSGIQLFAVVKEGGKRINRSVEWFVTPEGSERPLITKTSSGPTLQLDEGTYTIRAEIDGVHGSREIRVSKNGPKQFEVPVGLAQLNLRAVLEPGGETLKVRSWRLFRKGESTEKPGDFIRTGDSRTEQEFLLAPGSYYVEVSKDKATASKTFEVSSGQIIEDELVLAEQGKVKLLATLAEGGESVKVKVWEIYQRDASGELEKVQYDYHQNPTITLLPGKYLGKVTKDKLKKEFEFEIAAGKENRVEVLLSEQAKVTFAAVYENGGEPIKVRSWGVYRTDHEGKLVRVDYNYHQNPTIVLLPGDYIVKVDKDRVKEEANFSVAAGETKTVEVVLPAQGYARFRATLEPGGEAVKTKEWSVFSAEPDERGKLKRIDHSYQQEPNLVFLPGKYIAEVVKDKVTERTEFVVEPRKTTAVEIVLPAQGRAHLSAVLEGTDEVVAVNRWNIFKAEKDIDGREVKVEGSYHKDPTFTLIPGKYIARVEKEQVVKDYEFTVEPLVTTEVKVPVPAQGRVTLNAVTADGGVPAKFYRWQIYEQALDADGLKKRVETTSKKSPTITLLPGKYEAVAVLRDKSEVSTSFEVAGRDDKTLKVVVE